MSDCEKEMVKFITHCDLPSFCFFSSLSVILICVVFHMLSSSFVADEGILLAIDSSTVPQTPDDASFELVPSPVSLKEQKETMKISLHGIFHILTSGNITQLAYSWRVSNNIFNADWAPLDVRPLRAISDELFFYLECLKDVHNLGPTALFQQEVEQRLVDLHGQVENKRQELDIPITAQSETLAALETLRGGIERTRSMLAGLEQRYRFQQWKFEEQSSRMQACGYSVTITENELKDFEAMLKECLGANCQQLSHPRT